LDIDGALCADERETLETERGRETEMVRGEEKGARTASMQLTVSQTAKA
jgi:hypothetical protein